MKLLGLISVQEYIMALKAYGQTLKKKKEDRTEGRTINKNNYK